MTGSRGVQVDPPGERRSGADRRVAITVVLIDGEPLARSALGQAASAGGLELVGEAGNGEEAIELVLDLSPDVVVTALQLPGISGVETIERLSLFAPASRVLVLTHSEQNFVIEAILAGASGYVLKTAPPERIIRAIKATAAGESALSPEIAGKLLERIRETHIPVIAPGQATAGSIRSALTQRELEVFTLLASGNSNQQIAGELSVSTNTVRNHVKSILAKLHLENRIQAAVQAVRAGIS